MNRSQAGAEAYAGQLKKSRQFCRQSVELAQRQHLVEPAGLTAALEALTEAQFGNAGRARERAREALGMARGISTGGLAGQALAFSGDFRRAQPLPHELALPFPNATLLPSLSLRL